MIQPITHLRKAHSEFCELERTGIKRSKNGSEKDRVLVLVVEHCEKLSNLLNSPPTALPSSKRYHFYSICENKGFSNFVEKLYMFLRRKDAYYQAEFDFSKRLENL